MFIPLTLFSFHWVLFSFPATLLILLLTLSCFFIFPFFFVYFFFCIVFLSITDLKIPWTVSTTFTNEFRNIFFNNLDQLLSLNWFTGRDYVSKLIFKLVFSFFLRAFVLFSCLRPLSLYFAYCSPIVVLFLLFF
jgi:hypothetical protein